MEETIATRKRRASKAKLFVANWYLVMISTAKAVKRPLNTISMYSKISTSLFESHRYDINNTRLSHENDTASHRKEY
jgi:hypothetical protein